MIYPVTYFWDMNSNTSGNNWKWSIRFLIITADSFPHPSLNCAKQSDSVMIGTFCIILLLHFNVWGAWWLNALGRWI